MWYNYTGDSLGQDLLSVMYWMVSLNGVNQYFQTCMEESESEHDSMKDSVGSFKPDVLRTDGLSESSEEL